MYDSNKNNMGYTIFDNLLITNLRLMDKVIIVDASDSDCRFMSGLLTRAGYEPVIAEDMEAAKQEVAKLLSGAVINSQPR